MDTRETMLLQIQGFARIYRAAGDYRLANALDVAAERLENRIRSEDLGDLPKIEATA